jgi:hypothetical protein
VSGLTGGDVGAEFTQREEGEAGGFGGEVGAGGEGDFGAEDEAGAGEAYQGLGVAGVGLGDDAAAGGSYLWKSATGSPSRWTNRRGGW